MKREKETLSVQRDFPGAERRREKDEDDDDEDEDEDEAGERD